jgi:hypothetical protein
MSRVRCLGRIVVSNGGLVAVLARTVSEDLHDALKEGRDVIDH